MRLSELERELLRLGFRFRRQKGSHRHYFDHRGRRATVAVHRPGEVHPEHVDNLFHDLRRAGVRTGWFDGDGSGVAETDGEGEA